MFHVSPEWTNLLLVLILAVFSAGTWLVGLTFRGVLAVKDTLAEIKQSIALQDQKISHVEEKAGEVKANVVEIFGRLSDAEGDLKAIQKEISNFIGSGAKQPRRATSG